MRSLVEQTDWFLDKLKCASDTSDIIAAENGGFISSVANLKHFLESVRPLLRECAHRAEGPASFEFQIGPSAADVAVWIKTNKSGLADAIVSAIRERDGA